ncbi:uncharacterized protein LOC123448574 [Hordeum vulgare subsp. vulgare]|uniref:uncharacterized protein LOC123448574 n=1 Tax=Hordeum vulgare subsp. vulgare TaxID=112509 RepID=UPI00162CD3A1|nr:uncharacterized protein LOC123448574 [Hordeum vulgare subsp. vulgare]
MGMFGARAAHVRVPELPRPPTLAPLDPCQPAEPRCVAPSLEQPLPCCAASRQSPAALERKPPSPPSVACFAEAISCTLERPSSLCLSPSASSSPDTSARKIGGRNPFEDFGVHGTLLHSQGKHLED